MRLVITEKPSVAQSLAKVIGAGERRAGYLEGNGYLVSWCLGHLVEPAPPEAYDERYKRWRYECFLQALFGKSCRQKWRKLHLQNGESCRHRSERSFYILKHAGIHR